MEFCCREKLTLRDEESDELKDFQNQELGKVKHMLIIAENEVSDITTSFAFFILPLSFSLPLPPFTFPLLFLSPQFPFHVTWFHAYFPIQL